MDDVMGMSGSGTAGAAFVVEPMTYKINDSG